MVSTITILEYDKAQNPSTVKFSITNNNVRKVYVLDWGVNPEDKLLFAHDNNQNGIVLAQGPKEVNETIEQLLHDVPNKLGEVKNLNELFVAARYWSWAELMFC